jgi:DNA invertase Pin-like site-specific DNA recombinase
MSVPRALAIYTRVSTADQDSQRRVNELRQYTADSYSDHQVREYADIASRTSTVCEEYDRLQDDIDAGEIDRVIVDEICRLSRLCGGEIHEFLQHALDNDTSVEDREIDVSDDMVDQAVSELIAGLMGQLAKSEHKQKLRRIRLGIPPAQEARK